MKKAFWTLSAMALIGFSAFGCDEDTVSDAIDTLTDPCTYCVATLIDTNTQNPAIYCVETVNTINGKKKACSSYQECGQGQVFKIDEQDSRLASCVNDEHDNYCDTKADCEPDEECDTEIHECYTPDPNDQPTDFKYVRIDDASEDKYTGEWDEPNKCAKVKGGGCENDPGADIDAVLIVRGMDVVGNVGDIYDYHFGITQAGVTFSKDENAPKFATNPLNIKGEPDSIVGYGTADVTCKLWNDTGADEDCFYNSGKACQVRPFVSLGGPGGYIVVEMTAKLEAGDKLDILEVGDCKTLNCNDDSESTCKSRTAVKDGVKVYVSVTDDTNEGWKIVGDTGKEPTLGVISFDITEDIFTKADADLGGE